jgi:hypothetical protein
MLAMKESDDPLNSTPENKLAMLRSLVESSSGSAAVRSNATTRAQRLTDIEATMKKIVLREAKRFCNCQPCTAVIDPDEFERELKKVCPVHGFRNLGGLVTLVCTEPTEKDRRIEQLKAAYFEKLRKHLLGAIGGSE